MYLKYISQEEQVRGRRGSHAQQFVRNTSRAKTVRGILLPCVSSLATALFLIPILTFSPSTIGVEKSQISASAAIDYNKPYQTVHTQMSASRFASEFSTSGDYRYRSEIRSIPADSVYGSFKINASASDNWGEALEIWFTVIDETTGQYLYDSGWTLSPIVNQAVQVTSTTNTLQTYFRLRYPQDKGANPIGDSFFSGAEWSITYDRLVQTETFPEDWLSTTTAEIPVIIDTSTTVVSVPQDITTTVAPETVEQYLTLPAKVHSALLFMLSIVGRLLRLKYVTPAICFGLLVALAGWLLH